MRKPVNKDTVAAEVKRLEAQPSLSMREQFHLDCLRLLLVGLTYV